MANDWTTRLGRWVEAGLVDPSTAEAIHRWEALNSPPLAGMGSARLRTPVALALVMGAGLLAAGLLLFVSAHWAGLGPSSRFALLLAVVLGCHGAGALAAARFAALAPALHGVGTVALGGGLYLAGQTFHLDALWPEGLLLWALGAGFGWLLLGQWPQLALLALLAPGWLLAAWLRLCDQMRSSNSGLGDGPALIPAAGLLLLSLTYFSAPRSPHATGALGRRVLLWIGGLALAPAALLWALMPSLTAGAPPLPASLAACGWAAALGAPLILAWALGQRRLVLVGVAAAWLLAGLGLARWAQGLGAVQALAEAGPGAGSGAAVAQAVLHLWWLLGGLLLALWGSSSGRAERVNFGAATMAVTLLVYYFGSVFSQLDRAVGLLGLGLLFLAGGWGLERLRRRLLAGPHP
jgi:uncharacterized membrane protein